MLNLFRKIVMISFSFEINESIIKMYEKAIAKFITMWSENYKTFPKLHYLVHLPTAARKYFLQTVINPYFILIIKIWPVHSIFML